ncbi:hypothetical protein J3P71_21045 [Rhizobium leguminosarum]|uniref:hypothetical protein n=1 Tax=Rhizobium leguminosarum TaxID=384 RepID=UPI00143F1C34|nr:hypothetical protein [Rhizobium leguminosarum]MBY5840956.1 hypothetical protein [Rhizobium leguminosarum]QSZ10949.1 hypothetical protein J3P71_21045 [Rhizobium leguminosarum]
MDMQTSFLDRLFESGLLIDTGIDGLYGRSGIALALFHHHGLDVKQWPASVRKALWG